MDFIFIARWVFVDITGEDAVVMRKPKKYRIATFLSSIQIVTFVSCISLIDSIYYLSI